MKPEICVEVDAKYILLADNYLPVYEIFRMHLHINSFLHPR